MGRKSVWNTNTHPAEQPESNGWETHNLTPGPKGGEKAPTVADQIPEARRMDRREREPVVTFYGIPDEVHKALKKVADDLGVPVGDVARYFFEQGLIAMATGKLRVEPRLSEGRRTLFPTDGVKMPSNWGAPPTPKQAAAARAAKRKKKPGKKVSYRGVPRELVKGMSGAAERMKAPIGELARKLLEWGLTEYTAGRLTMTAYVESDTEKWTIYE